MGCCWMDAVPEADFPSILDATWLEGLPRFDLFKLGGDVNLKGDQLAAPVGIRGERNICTPLHPSYSARGYIASREQGVCNCERACARIPYTYPRRDRRRCAWQLCCSFFCYWLQLGNLRLYSQRCVARG